jgi:hypothetical protein
MARLDKDDALFVYGVCTLHMKRIALAPDLARTAGRLAVDIRDRLFVPKGQAGQTRDSQLNDVWLDADDVGRMSALVDGVVRQPKGQTQAEKVRLIEVAKCVGCRVSPETEAAVAVDPGAGVRDAMVRAKRWWAS